jgi:hypothetical protein
MKTKIRIFFTVSALAFVGALNAYATVNLEEKNSTLIGVNENLTSWNEKIALFESEINGGIDYQREAQMITRWIADMAEAKTTMKMMENNLVSPNETIHSLENEAEIESNGVITDLAQEAQLITKLIADKEEAKAIQKMMDRGFAAPNETIQLFENEVGFENNDMITDFGKEAQLMTKIIADKEETKAVQRLIAEGKLVENE